MELDQLSSESAGYTDAELTSFAGSPNGATGKPAGPRNIEPDLPGKIETRSDVAKPHHPAKVSGSTRQDKIVAEAQRCLKAGIQPVPIPRGKKHPEFSGWQSFRCSSADIELHFGQSYNIGVLLGEASNGLVDIDLDHDDAKKAADYLLPETSMVLGRKSSPRAHYFYCVPGAKSYKLDDPSVADKPGILELRVKGVAPFPPTKIEKSSHFPVSKGGEELAWVTPHTLKPAQIEAADLEEAIKHVGAAVLLGRRWCAGKRHDMALALAGALASAEWNLEDACRLVRATCAVASDRDVEDRITAVRTTFERFERDEKVQGFPTLMNFLEPSVGTKLAELLKLGTEPAQEPEVVTHVWAPADLKSWLTVPPPETNWLFENIIPLNTVAVLGGTGGVGKTFFLLQLAISLATGRGLFSSIVPARAFRVMLFVAEDPADEIRRRVHRIGQAYGLSPGEHELLWKHLILYPRCSEPLLRAENGNARPTPRYDWLLERVKETRTEVLILDPKSRWAAVDENNNDHATRFVSLLEQLPEPCGGTVILSHHLAKSKNGDASAASARGASALTDACRVYVGLVEATADDLRGRGISDDIRAYVKADTTKQNYAPKLAAPILFHKGTGGVLRECAQPEDVEEKLLDVFCGWLKANGAINKSEFLIPRTEKGKALRKALLVISSSKRNQRQLLLTQALKLDLVELVKNSSTGGAPAEQIQLKAKKPSSAPETAGE